MESLSEEARENGSATAAPVVPPTERASAPEVVRGSEVEAKDEEKALKGRAVARAGSEVVMIEPAASTKVDGEPVEAPDSVVLDVDVTLTDSPEEIVYPDAVPIELGISDPSVTPATGTVDKVEVVTPVTVVELPTLVQDSIVSIGTALLPALGDEGIPERVDVVMPVMVVSTPVLVQTNIVSLGSGLPEPVLIEVTPTESTDVETPDTVVSLPILVQETVVTIGPAVPASFGFAASPVGLASVGTVGAVDAG